jgi:MFS family permease
MVLALFSALGQAGLIGPLTRRFGEKPVAVFAVIGASISLVIFALAVNDAMVWSALVLYGIANGLFLPSVSSLVSFEAEADSRGAVMGMFNASSSAGRIIGPAIAGPIYFNVGSSAPFWISAVIAALGAIFLSRAHARPAS